jgi:hypothetical protein
VAVKGRYPSCLISIVFQEAGTAYQNITITLKNVVETEGTIKNGQSRDIGNNGKTRHSTKTNKHKNTTHEIKKMSNKKIMKTDSIHILNR